MSKPLYSICLICKDEEKTLPRLLESLSEFRERGGEICAVDTGSKDYSVAILRSYGCIVEEVGERYLLEVDNVMGINQKFVVDGGSPVVKKGDKYFNFSAARNHASSLAKNDFVFFYDCDEISVAMNIDIINKHIEDGMTQAEYQFVFSYDQWGGEAVKFFQCKAFDRRHMEWRGIVHELVSDLGTGVSKRVYLDESIYKLGHKQNNESGRHIYMTGLAVDCFNNPSNDRHSHYFARELFWLGHYKSALKEFKRHIGMMGWAAERAESLNFIGDIYGKLNDPLKQVQSYTEAFYIDCSRNKPLVNIALFYRHVKQFQAAVCYAKAALEIPHGGFYADDLAFSQQIPNEILYSCYGNLPHISNYIGKAKEHLLKALEYQPYNPVYLRDTQFYFPYHDRAEIQGWMRFPELLWLFEQAASGKYKNIFECGSWKGKSTHALLTGSKGKEGVTVTCVDTWKGSDDERDDTNWMAKKEDVFATFQKNTAGFDNLKTIRKSSVEAAKDVPDESIDLCFVDMGHTYVDVMSDLKAWYPKVKKDGIICGHDYTEGTWQEVVQAVNEVFGKPDKVIDSIWFVDLSKRGIIELPEPTTTKIPRKIYTAWLGDNMPELVQKCIESQKKMCEEFGYEHYVLTLENIPIGLPYLTDAINSTHPNGVKYCKATDYLRMHYLLNYGGVFIDSDFEILPGKNFDAMLNDQMFVGLEVANWEAGKVVLGTAVVGSIPNHPMIKEWMETVEANFSGSDSKNYESSMDLLNKIGVKWQHIMKLYNPDFFYPYEWLHTGKTTITENTIGIHHFCRTWIPENNQKSTLQQFKYNIENNINFTFVKRGDGEIACMNGEVGGNCDGHPYSKELGDKLREAYEYLEGKATIVEFDDQKNYNVLLHRTDSNLKEVGEFYKAISGSCRDKVLVAPEKLRPMAKYLKAELIVVPELNMFSIYNKTFGAIPVIENGIYMFCAGMPAKLLIEDMHRINPNATYLDCGSAFDPSFAQSRTEQITKEQFWMLYHGVTVEERKADIELIKNISKENIQDMASDFWGAEANQIIQNNFNIPQEVHPERLWAANQIKPNDVALDLGCGKNKTLPSVIGVDIREGVTDYCGDIHELRFEDNLVDVVISKHSIEHLIDPVKALKEWIRVLKPGGKIIIVLPDHEFINTIDPYYSNGEHLHAYTRESFANLISLFPELHIAKQETVLKDWSFGTVVYKLPKVTFLIPHICGKREIGLHECQVSIDNLNYPKHLIETIVIGGDDTVPEKIHRGLKEATGDIIAYAANDMTYEPDSMRIAVVEMLELGKGLVSFNEGALLPDKGNIATHFIVSKEVVKKLENQQIFSTDMKHCGVDNWLWAQCEKLNEAHYSEAAKITHHHFSKQGNQFDETYSIGWRFAEQDRATLKEKLLTLGK